MNIETKTLSYRDNYIDIVKGLAVLAILFIHTVFWSGESYVPVYMQNIALLFDVPVFFLMTGCALSFTGIKEKFIPGQILKISTTFTLVIILFQILFRNFDIKLIIDSVFLNQAIIPEFVVFGGSYWFVPVYVVSIIFASVIIKYKPNAILGILVLCWLYYFLRFVNVTDVNTSFLGISLSGFFFYACLILLGYKFYENKNNNKTFFWIFMIAIITLLIMQYKTPNFRLQNYKFPLSYVYVSASMISVSAILLLKNFGKKIIQRYPCPFLTYIGKNSIDFYLSQGISSSLLYKIIPLIQLPYGIKLCFAFILNAIMAILIGFVLQKTLLFIPTVFKDIADKFVKLLKNIKTF